MCDLKESPGAAGQGTAGMNVDWPTCVHRLVALFIILQLLEFKSALIPGDLLYVENGGTTPVTMLFIILFA